MAKLVLNSPEDNNTKITILYQNRKESDVLLREELIQMVSSFESRVKLVFACSQAGPHFESSAVPEKVCCPHSILSRTPSFTSLSSDPSDIRIY